MSELIYREDYSGLVAYCEARASRRPHDARCLYYLGEAYVFDRQYDRALEVLKGLHQHDPEDEDTTHRILDALFGLELDETHFQWLEEPEVVRITTEFIDACYDYLKPKRKARSVDDLIIEIGRGAYCAFSEGDLIEAVSRDGRFLLEGWEKCPDIRVRLPARRRQRARR